MSSLSTLSIWQSAYFRFTPNPLSHTHAHQLSDLAVLPLQLVSASVVMLVVLAQVSVSTRLSRGCSKVRTSGLSTKCFVSAEVVRRRFKHTRHKPHNPPGVHTMYTQMSRVHGVGVSVSLPDESIATVHLPQTSLTGVR